MNPPCLKPGRTFERILPLLASMRDGDDSGHEINRRRKAGAIFLDSVTPAS